MIVCKPEPAPRPFTTPVVELIEAYVPVVFHVPVPGGSVRVILDNAPVLHIEVGPVIAAGKAFTVIGAVT